MLSENYKWNIINEFFKKKGFVSHQVDTFNDYINNGIQRVITESDIVVNLSPTQKYTVSFDNIYIPKPSIIEEDRTVRPMFPSEARQRDLTYDSPIFVDVIEKTETDDKDPEITVHNRIIIGRTPIMLLSDKCNLKKLTLKERVGKGECEKDYGGYFIIRGKERALVGQLRGVYNQPIVLLQKPNDKWKYICEVRSMSEETGHSVLLQAKIGVNDRSIVFNIPYIKEIIPVGILFKALGFLTEYEISNIIGNKDNNEKIKKYIKFIIRDSYHIKTQEDALKYISQFTVHVIKDDKKIDYTTQVVENELLPHMGIFATIKEKSYFLGMMVNKLICTYIGIRKEDDRDNYSNKRVEMAGVLCCELFRTLFKRFIKSIIMHLEKKKQYPDIINIISRTSGITSGLKSCFSTGSWSVTRNNYVRTGVSQVLSRLTFAATLSHLRRVVIPIGKEGKNSKIRQIHSSQIMYICNCVTGDTEVLLGDNKSVKFIKDLVEGIDEIMTINPVTLEKEKSAFYNKFNLLPEQIYEVETFSGRKVKCTPDHPFLVRRNDENIWVDAKDLVNNDLMFIKHYVKYLPDNDGRLLKIVSGDKIQNLSIRLSEACARLFALFISTRYNERILKFSSPDDMDDVIDDMALLGISRPVCRIGSESSMIVSRELSNFMISIGFDYSNKFGSLPRWLIESPSSVKREFLSAFQGCNGGSFYYNEEFEHILISNTFICDFDNEHDKSQCILAHQISEMFTNFGIQNNISFVKKMVNNLNFRNLVKINIENNLENLDRYSDIVWYRYSIDKIIVSSILLEFLKTVMNNKNKHYSLTRFKKKLSLGIDDIVLSPIYCIRKNIPVEPVYDLTTKSGNHSFMVNSVVGSNCETPEGQSIGIVMNLALSTLVTRRIPTVVVKEIIESCKNIIFINDYDGVNDKPKIFLNGILMGITENVDEFIKEMKDFRKNGLLDKEISITFDDVDNEIKIYCDEGRFIRPLLTVNDDGIPNIYKFYEEHKETKIPDWDEMLEKQFVSYVDNSEIQSYVIAMDDNDLKKRKNDLFEICPSMMLGVMASGIPFPDHNQSPRNIYQCLCPETDVLMFDGSRKAIKDVKNGDKVITFDPKTLKISTTKVINQYVRETTQKIYKIKTTSGREIIATENHPFMTPNGWCKVGEMNEQTKIGIYLKYTNIRIEEMNLEKKNDCIFIHISSITEVPNQLISDITVEHENHSFIAGNGFLSSNSSMG